MAPRRIEVTLSFSDLDLDRVSGEGIYACVNFEETKEKYKEIGRTEVIPQCSSGQFETPVDAKFYFERLQRVQVCLMTVVDSCEKELGHAIIDLGKMVAERNARLILTEKVASMQIVTTEIPESSGVSFEMRGEGLDKKDLFGKSDPYVCIYREDGENKWKLAHKTEYIHNTLNPQWKPFTVDYNALCGGDVNATIKLSCYDHDASRNDLIGECTLTFSDIINNDAPSTFLVINPKKKAKKKDYKKSGKITILKCKEIKHHSFVEFISGGCQIQFTCGVDFTASNGDPRQSSSLHYTGGLQPNDYVKAIRAIGNVVQDYAKDINFPAYGFGAKLPPNNQVSHDFPLNLNSENPTCAGITGIVEQYTAAIGKVKLWGPTNVSPIVQLVATLARNAHNYPEQQQYFVLLILTDGVVTDMEDTLQAIVDASDLPMSVIIAGIGNADFTGMKSFEMNEKGKLKAPNGNSTERCIVQFVPFRNFKLASPEAFAATVLIGIPAQIESYFKMHKIAPHARHQADRINSEIATKKSASEKTQEAENNKAQPVQKSSSDSEQNEADITQQTSNMAALEVDCNA